MSIIKVNKKFFSYKLVAKQFNIEEELAKKLIMSGEIFLDNDHSYKINISDKYSEEIIFWHKTKKYKISRGEEKLREAIKAFNIQIINKICIDIGSSTGGFTHVLLENNAKFVYAVDSGENQLDYGLRINPKVKSMEKYNFRYAKFKDFDQIMNIITMDVSHISILKLFHNIKILTDKNSDIIILIKPQFEAKYNQVIDGLVKDKVIHFNIIKTILTELKLKHEVFLHGLIFSPILGKNKGNIEYLAHFKTMNSSSEINDEFIKNVINDAWKKLYYE